jgi:hypothetical protein
MTKNWKKMTAEKIKFFGDQKLTFYLSLGLQATEETFSPQKRKSSTQNMIFLNFF